MAVTKIKCRTSGTDKAIQYILNGDKTQGQILTARLNCDPGYEYRQMKDTKEYFGKDKGRQCYHIIISYKPGEITPELALIKATFTGSGAKREDYKRSFPIRVIPIQNALSGFPIRQEHRQETVKPRRVFRINQVT